MSALWAKFVTWLRNKFGRIVTWVGSVSMLTDIWDPAPVREPLQRLFGDYWGSKALAILTVACLVLSFARHQQVANRETRLREAGEPPTKSAG